MNAMATKPALPKAPYNPVKAVEGMFNGSITRIAQVFQDPAGYGPSTKGILGFTSKKFQDALDDCEIQLLDAKWYLEHQLALNAAKRQAKAKEDGATAAAKRKLEEMKDAEMVNGVSESQENPPKRQKVDEARAEPMEVDEPPAAQLQAQVEVPPPVPEATEASKPTEQAPKSLPSKSAAPSNPQVTIPKAPPDQSASQTRPTTADGPPKTTPHDTPANEVFNFESVFDDPPVDDGFNFDLQDLNTDAFGDSINLEDPSSLNSLLPDLESYANQTGDDAGDFSLGKTMGGDAGTGMGDDFGQPDIGGNDWDALLNDTDMGNGDLGSVDDIMNDNSTLNIDDFDTFFNEK